MKVLRTLMVGVAASALMAGSAVAADLMMEPPAMDEVMTDWSGVYIGANLGAQQFYGPLTVNEGDVELVGGFNAQMDNFLFGAEGFLGGYWNDYPDQGFYAGAEARLGVLVTPEVLLYGAGGALIRTSGNSYWTGGGGLELLVSDSVSLDLEYKHLWEMGGGYQSNSISAGLNLHMN